MGLQEHGRFQENAAKEPENVNIKRRIIAPVWRLIKVGEVSTGGVVVPVKEATHVNFVAGNGD